MSPYAALFSIRLVKAIERIGTTRKVNGVREIESSSPAYAAVYGMTRMVEVFGNVEKITVDYLQHKTDVSYSIKDGKGFVGMVLIYSL